MITKDRFTTIVMTVVVWGLAGGVFGTLFTGLHQVLAGLDLPGWQPLVGAAAAAGMTTSALYGAMPVALTGAMAGVLASIGSLILFGHDLALQQIASMAALTGLALGSFYAWMADCGGRPLVETLIGLASGLIAGLGLVALDGILSHPVGTPVLAAGVVAVVGTLFQVSQRWLVGNQCTWIPGGLSAAVVAGLVAGLVASAIWILGDTGSPFIDSASSNALAHVRAEIPSGFAGGLMGGAVTGLVLELLGFHLEDHV